MSIERRIEKLENYEESRDPDKQKVKLIIYQLSGGPEPTEEEIEGTKKKFLEEHLGHQGHIVLNFLHLAGEGVPK